MPELYDSLGQVTGGQQGNLDSRLLRKDQFWQAVNINCRDGFPKSRPGIQTRSFSGNATDLMRFAVGKYQGSAIYQSETSMWIIIVVSGRIYRFDPQTWEMDCYSNQKDEKGHFYVNQYQDRVWLCQAERYMIIQDGHNDAIILEGGKVSRANPYGYDSNGNRDWEQVTVPTGTIMAYGQGRLYIKNSPYSFLAGNIWLPNNPANVLSFTETQYTNGGGALGVSPNLGEITAMHFIINTASGTGLGQLMVFCIYGCECFNVSVPRQTTYSFNSAGNAVSNNDGWLNVNISNVVITEHGCVSADGVATMNADLIYAAVDGVRSVRINVAEIQSLWYGLMGSHTISAEVNNFLEMETPWLQKFQSVAIHNNRVFMTTGGTLLNALDSYGNVVYDWGFMGMLVLDYSNMAGAIASKIQPVWDGVWTRHMVLGMLSANFNKQRLFFICKDAKGLNCIEELDETTYTDDDTRIVSQIWTKALDFSDQQQNRSFMLKQLSKTELWLSGLRGIVDVLVDYRPDDYPQWIQFGRRNFCAPMQTADYPDYPFLPQARTKATFLSPKDYLNQVTRDMLTRGYHFAFRIAWVGTAKLNQVLIQAYDKPVVPQDKVQVTEDCITMNSAPPELPDDTGGFTMPDVLPAGLGDNDFMAPWEYVPPYVGGLGDGGGGTATDAILHKHKLIPGKLIPGDDFILGLGDFLRIFNPGESNTHTPVKRGTPHTWRWGCNRWQCTFVVVPSSLDPNQLVYKKTGQRLVNCTEITQPGGMPSWYGLLDPHVDNSNLAQGAVTTFGPVFDPWMGDYPPASPDCPSDMEPPPCSLYTHAGVKEVAHIWHYNTGWNNGIGPAKWWQDANQVFIFSDVSFCDAALGVTSGRPPKNPGDPDGPVDPALRTRTLLNLY